MEVIMQRLLIRRSFSIGKPPAAPGGSPLIKLLGTAILGAAGYFGYRTYEGRQKSPPPTPVKRKPSPPRMTLTEFVAKEMGPVSGRTPEDLRKFVESSGKYSPPEPPRPAPVPKPVEVTPPKPVETKPVIVAQVIKAEEPVKTSSVLETQIKQLEESLAKAKKELQVEQETHEKELVKRIEESIAAQMEAILPKLSATLKPLEHATTAQALVAQMDFAKSTAEDVKAKLETIISAYEHRIETLGLAHFDVISDRLKVQKEKWRRKIEDVQKSFAEDLKQTAAKRDEEWREALAGELRTAESHFAEQSLLDQKHAQQETALELTLKHKQEVEEITASLAKATEERLLLLNEILDRLKEMEDIQTDHAQIIEKLKQVHVLHTTVESLQRTLTKDEGVLTTDLKVLESLAAKDEVVAASLASLAGVYSSMVERGIPTLAQIHRHFHAASDRARLAALIRDKSFWGYLSAKLTYLLLPSGIGTVDDANTFSVLRAADDALERGDLRLSVALLQQLEGFPREEVEAFIQDASIRLSVTAMLEVLSENAIGLVNDITKKQLS